MTATTVANPAAVSDGAVNVLDETRINFDEAADLLPGRKGRPTRQAVRRWAVEGTLVKDEQTGEVRRVRLEARRCGGTWYTSREACARYLTACNPAEGQSRAARTPAANCKAADAAGRKLAAKGI